MTDAGAVKTGSPVILTRINPLKSKLAHHLFSGIRRRFVQPSSIAFTEPAMAKTCPLP